MADPQDRRWRKEASRGLYHKSGDGININRNVYVGPPILQDSADDYARLQAILGNIN